MVKIVDKEPAKAHIAADVANSQAEQSAPLEAEIWQTCAELADFLVAKNRAYGNSAAAQVGIFAKRFDTLAQIDVRIDDKLSRLKRGHEYPGDDTVKDLAGYLVLRMAVQSHETQEARELGSAESAASVRKTLEQAAAGSWTVPAEGEKESQ